MDETPNPLEERPFTHELSEGLRSAVQQARMEPPPALSLARSLERARRLGPGRANPWLRYHRAATAAAVAAVLFLAFGLLLICWHYEPASNSQNPNHRMPATGGARVSAVAVFVDHGPGQARADGFGRSARAEEPFLDAASNPTSTFPLSIDETAYPELRPPCWWKSVCRRPTRCAWPA